MKLPTTSTLLVTLLCVSVCERVLGDSQTPNGNSGIVCPPDDTYCPQDLLGFEAISRLHQQIDDDKNGKLEWEESDEFMREELKYEDNFDRQARFHGADDHISVLELWNLWVTSPVYNWTTDDVLEWLVDSVDLPQYIENFQINEVHGRILPRLAVNGQYQTSILGIKSSVHRQKVSIKSTDVVLFGPPKKAHNYLKDVALVASLVIATGGCWLAYIQHKYSQKHLQKLAKDLDTLQKAEDALINLQEKFEDAETERRTVAEEKKNLERKLSHEVHNSKTEAERLRVTREATAEEISRLKLAEEELVQVRMALQEAEMQLEEQENNMPLPELQQWLQLTYEIETKHYEAKREAAEIQLGIAKEMCEKIRRKRSAFLGSIRVAHTTSIDDTDGKILSARSALEEVKLDLQERSQRWRQIETICGFNIITNPGLQYLESLLRGVNQARSYLTRNTSASVLAPVSLDEADEDLPPGVATAQAGQLLAPPPDLRPRSAAMSSGFTSCSSNSINSASSHQLAGLRSQMRNRSSSLLTRPHPSQVGIRHSDDLTNISVPVAEDEKSEDAVSFQLGPSSDKDGKKQTEATSYKKSQSLDNSIGSAVKTKPHTLTPSLSESALKDHLQRANNSSPKENTVKENGNTAKSSIRSKEFEKDGSSSQGDSTDSTSLVESTEPKKSSKKKLFRLFKDGVKKKSS